MRIVLLRGQTCSWWLLCLWVWFLLWFQTRKSSKTRNKFPRQVLKRSIWAINFSVKDRNSGLKIAKKVVINLLSFWWDFFGWFQTLWKNLRSKSSNPISCYTQYNWNNSYGNFQHEWQFFQPQKPTQVKKNLWNVRSVSTTIINTFPVHRGQVSRSPFSPIMALTSIQPL